MKKVYSKRLFSYFRGGNFFGGGGSGVRVLLSNEVVKNDAHSLE